MTGYEFGDTVLVPFPFSNLSAAKRRPAVVVSSREYQSQRPDILILAITSQASASPAALESAVVGWREAGLLKPSVLEPVLATIEKSLVPRRLGRLSEADQRALRELLISMLGYQAPPSPVSSLLV